MLTKCSVQFRYSSPHNYFCWKAALKGSKINCLLPCSDEMLQFNNKRWLNTFARVSWRLSMASILLVSSN